MSSLLKMMQELVESLPPGVSPIEVSIKCRGPQGNEIEWHVPVMEIEHANYNVGRAVANQIANALRERSHAQSQCKK